MSYLTASDLQDESAWEFTNWQPRLDGAGFTAYLGRVCTRVGLHVKYRVGAVRYATTDATEQAILLEAELCLAQYYLCLATAAIANSSEDPLQNPVAGAGSGLEHSGEAYKGRAEEILAWFGTARWDASGGPARAAVGDPNEALMPHLDQTVDWARPS